MFGFSPFSQFPFSAIGVATPVPPIIIDFDTHDGGKKKFKEKLAKEIKDKKRRRQEIVDLYEQIVEGKPAIAAEIVAPYVKQATISEIKSINFDALMADVNRVQQMYDTYIEMDDEEVLALL